MIKKKKNPIDDRTKELSSNEIHKPKFYGLLETFEIRLVRQYCSREM
jgi:hypothetical protein